jgi:RNA polymerase sigma factor (sigma-70 family)
MSDKAASVFRQLRFVVASWKEETRTDAELLRHFVRTRDEAAFSTLVGRHSELVWGVCLRVLHNPADAEDALQATFLRLARDARRVDRAESVGGWLLRAARDCAVDLQRAMGRQRRIEERAAAVARTAEAAASSDLRVILDDELAQLPQSERAVLVLCCLEGRTYADAALELGCSTAAVHRRFVRAQTRLRRRFARHGKHAAGMLAAVFAGTILPAASAAPPVALAHAVEAGVAYSQTGLVPATRAAAVAFPAATGLSRAGLAGLAAAVALVVAAALLAATPTPPEPVPNPPLASAPEPEPAVGLPVTGVVRGAAGAPVPGAAVVVLARRPFGPGERGLRDEVLAEATADAAGRFRLRVPDDFDTWFAGRAVTVRASAPGAAPATLPVRLRPAPGPLVLTLPTATALRGALLDADGRPAAGVRVEVVRVGDAVAEPVVGVPRAAPPGWPAAAITDADGAFALPALGGAANVWVRVDDPRFALDTFRLDGRTDAMRLDPARPLTVEVRAADTGAALAGARVTVITDRRAAHPHFCATDYAVQGPWTVPADVDAVTDAAGRVRVTLAPGDRAEVLVSPAAESGPYVGMRVKVDASDTANGRLLAARVPRGRWLTGTVTADGRPLAGAAVHWGRESATLPEWDDEVLAGRDALTRTGPDGAFRLAVLPGACSVRAYGPTADYESTSARLPGTANTTLYAHAITRIEVPADGDVPPVHATLRRATPLTGRVERDVPDSGSTLLLASGRVSPVRGYAALPLPVRGGGFTVPAGRPGHVTRAYLLDPGARVGAVVDVTPGAADPVATLVPCGTLRLRVLDSDGRPKAGHAVNVSLLVDRDRAPAAAAVADGQPVQWFDAVNYPERPKTDADGRLELPALVPGARYAVSAGTGAAKLAVGTFAVESARTVTIPDVVLPAPSEGGPR